MPNIQPQSFLLFLIIAQLYIFFASETTTANSNDGDLNVLLDAAHSHLSSATSPQSVVDVVDDIRCMSGGVLKLDDNCTSTCFGAKGGVSSRRNPRRMSSKLDNRNGVIAPPKCTPEDGMFAQSRSGEFKFISAHEDGSAMKLSKMDVISPQVATE